MVQFTPSYKKAILSIALLCTHSVLISATQPEVAEIIQSHIDATTFTELQSHAQRQFDVIVTVLDTIGQNLSNGATKLQTTKKAATQKKITDLRTSADQIKRIAAVNLVDEEQLYNMIIINAEFISVLDRSIQSNLSSIPSFDLEAVTSRFLTADDITEATLQNGLATNDKKLLSLVKNSEKIGLSVFNTAYRSARQFYKTWAVGDVIEHVVVYSAFLVWLTYVTSAGKIEALPTKADSNWWFGRKAHQLKKWVISLKNPSEITDADGNVTGMRPPVIGGKPFESQVTVEVPANVVAPSDMPGVAEAIGPMNPRLRTLTMQNDIETGKPLDPRDVTSDIAKGKLNVVATTRGVTDVVPAGKVISQMPATTNDHSGFNKGIDILSGGILNITHGQMFSFGIAPAFANYITKDAAKLYGIWLRKKSRLDDMFFGASGKKKSEYDQATIPTERFKDIVGREDVKAELSRIVDFMCDPDRFQRAGIKVDRGILLAGSPQTGKTMIARALAGEISEAFEARGISQTVRLFELNTEGLAKYGIQFYMDQAKKLAPCVLFIDELDLLRLQRDGDTKMLSEFLTAMSGSLNNNEKDHVVIIAATNKPQNVDFALRQNGRFGKIFWFDNPTFKHRIEFFLKECEKRCMSFDSFDFIGLAQQTEGCSFGTLDIVMKNALLYAKLENAPVSQAHFEKSINLNVKHLIPHGYTVPTEKEQIVAVRQAGKALVSMLLKPAKQLCTVTVLPITQDFEETHVTQQYNFGGDMKRDELKPVALGGIFSYHLSDALGIEPQNELVKQCKILLASNAAQRVFGLDSCATDKADKQEAFNLTKQIVFDGLDAKEIAKSIREEKLVEAYKLLEQYEKEVETLLSAHKDELKTVVSALQKRKTLSATDIKELLNWLPAQAKVVTPAA